MVVHHLAIRTKVIDLIAFLDVVAVDCDGANAGIHVAVSAEVIRCAVNFLPLTLQEVRTEAVAGTDRINNPRAGSDAVLVKGIFDLVDGLFTIDSNLHGSRISIGPAGDVAFNGLPASLHLASKKEICIAIIDHEDTIAVNHITAFAGQLLIHNRIVVAGSLKFGAPIDDRLAHTAVGSAGIAIFSAGSRYFRQINHVAFVVVPGIDVVVEHRFDTAAAAKGNGFTINGIGIAEQHIIFNRDNRAIAGRKLCLGGNRQAGNVINAVPGPDADRQAQQSLFAAQRAVLRAGQHNCDDILNGMNVSVRRHRSKAAVALQQDILNLEAGDNRNAFQFPVVGRVQLNIRFNIFNILCIGGLDIHIVDGIVFRLFTGIVVTRYIDQSGLVFCTLFCAHNSEQRRLLRAIAQLVSDFEGNSVSTDAQRNIARRHHILAGQCGFYHIAIDVNHRSRCIKARIAVADFGRETNHALSDGCIGCSISHVTGSIHDITDGRCIAIIHRRAVVQRDIVNVEGQLCRSHRLDVGTQERGRTAVSCRFIRLHRRQVVIFADIDRSIYPAVGRDILFRTAVQILAGTADRCKHEMILFTTRAIPELRLECQTGSAFRNIQPEAQRRCIQTIGNITENALFANVEQNVIAPAGKSGISIVERHTQSIITILDLAIITACKESINTHLLIELTCQRAVSNQRIVDIVVNTPLLGILEAHPVRDIAILEVPVSKFSIISNADNFRALAESDLEGRRSKGFIILILRSDHYFSNRRIICCGILHAVLRACILVGERPGKGIRIEVNVIVAFFTICISPDIHFHGEGSAVRKSSLFAGELRHNRMCNSKNHLSFLAIDGKDNGNLAKLAIGGEHAVFNGAKAVVRQRPDAALGHFHGLTVRAHCRNAHGIFGVRRHISIVRLDFYCVKSNRFLQILSIDSQNDRVDGGTLSTVRRNRTHHGRRIARASGNEGGRTAAVTVDCIHAAKCEHHLTHLVVGQTGGNSAITAVTLHEQQGAIRLDANHGTGGVRRGTLNGLTLQNAVLDQPAEVGRYCKMLVSIQGRRHAAQFAIAFFVDGQIGLRTLMVCRSTQNLAKVNHVSIGCIDIVSQCSIHRAYDFVTKLLVICNRLGQCLCASVLEARSNLIGLFCSVCISAHRVIIRFKIINLIVSGQYIDVRRINLEEVYNLAVIAVTVVQNHLNFGRTFGKRVRFFTDDVEVAIADSAVISATRTRHGHRSRDLLTDGSVELRHEVQLSSILFSKHGQLSFRQRMDCSQGCFDAGISGNKSIHIHQRKLGFKQNPKLILEINVIVRHKRIKAHFDVQQRHKGKLSSKLRLQRSFLFLRQAIQSFLDSGDLSQISIQSFLRMLCSNHFVHDSPNSFRIVFRHTQSSHLNTDSLNCSLSSQNCLRLRLHRIQPSQRVRILSLELSQLLFIQRSHGSFHNSEFIREHCQLNTCNQLRQYGFIALLSILTGILLSQISNSGLRSGHLRRSISGFLGSIGSHFFENLAENIENAVFFHCFRHLGRQLIGSLFNFLNFCLELFQCLFFHQNHFSSDLFFSHLIDQNENLFRSQLFILIQCRIIRKLCAEMLHQQFINLQLNLFHQGSFRIFIGLLCRFLDGLLDRFLDGFLNRFLDGFLSRFLDGFLSRFLDGFLSRFLNGLLDGFLNRFLSRLLSRFLGRLLDGFLSRFIDRFLCRNL